MDLPAIPTHNLDLPVYKAAIPSELAEVNGSRTESYTDTEFTGHVEFTCPWDERFIYADYMMGTIYNHHVPDLETPCFYNFFFPAAATSVSISTWGAEGVTVPNVAGHIPYQAYTLAKLAVDYKGLSRPGSWSLQEQVSPSFGARTLPSWGYYWRTDASPVLDQEAPVKQEVQVKINRTIHGVRVIPWWFYQLAGCVNINPWTDALTHITYLPGTLMFVPTNSDRTITYVKGDDDGIWTISFELNWNPIGWNNFQRPHGVDSMMRYDKNAGGPVAVVNYPFRYFPAMTVDPNDPATSQLFGDAYSVWLQRENGTTYIAEIDTWGNVIDIFN